MTDKEQEKNNVYELGYLVISSLPEEKLSQEVDGVKKILEDNGATFISEQFPEMQPLAYPVEYTYQTEREKFEHAYFGWVTFDTTSEDVETINEQLKDKENLLRFILLKITREEAERQKEKTSYAVTDNKEEGGATADSDKEIDESIDELVKEE